jgi:hypothetical protein
VHVIHSAWFSEDANFRNSLISLEIPALAVLLNSLIPLMFQAIMAAFLCQRKGKRTACSGPLGYFGSISILPNGN